MMINDSLAGMRFSSRIGRLAAALTVALFLACTASAQERADYLTIWLEDATSGGETKVIALAKKFIQEHESSGLVASVRMKLGEMYYRAEDFARRTILRRVDRWSTHVCPAGCKAHPRDQLPGVS